FLRNCVLGACCLLVIGPVAVVPPVLGQQSSHVLTGSWTASVGDAHYFRGTWSAQISAQTPNSAQGSWTLLNESSEISLQGTWSARKTSAGWEGHWTARTVGGSSLSGNWSSDLQKSEGHTLADLLKRSREKQVAGGWQSGRMQGYWWL